LSPWTRFEAGASGALRKVHGTPFDDLEIDVEAGFLDRLLQELVHRQRHHLLEPLVEIISFALTGRLSPASLMSAFAFAGSKR
jgi:hypothetical protein